jgi:hypothetical protein
MKRWLNAVQAISGVDAKMLMAAQRSWRERTLNPQVES